jgi:hypothetical protein
MMIYDMIIRKIMCKNITKIIMNMRIKNKISNMFKGVIKMKKVKMIKKLKTKSRNKKNLKKYEMKKNILKLHLSLIIRNALGHIKKSMKNKNINLLNKQIL